MEIPSEAYLAVIADSYSAERRLWYNIEDGPQEYVVSAGVPQGFVLGPLLWNIMYNNVLNALPLPEEAPMVYYAVDIALVVVAKHFEDTELNSSKSISAIKGWLESSRLTLAVKKATKRRKRNYAPIQLENHVIISKPAIKYLGVMIDGKLSYRQHVQFICNKTSTESMALARMMANLGRPRFYNRLLIARSSRS